MPRSVAEWDRRRSGSISISDYHRWALGKLATDKKIRDRSQVICRIIEEAAEAKGFTVEKYLEEYND